MLGGGARRAGRARRTAGGRPGRATRRARRRRGGRPDRHPRRDPETGVIGAADVRRASAAISTRVRELLVAGACPVVVGGDCTLLLGDFQALPPGSGLWFVDGHADFFDGESSPTGEAADMDLAILTGHGPPGRPLVAAPNLLGVSVADFNPDRDPDGGDAVRVVDALAALWT